MITAPRNVTAGAAIEDFDKIVIFGLKPSGERYLSSSHNLTTAIELLKLAIKEAQSMTEIEGTFQ